MNGELKDIGNQLTKYEDGGTNRFKLELLEKDIVTANILVEGVMQAFEKVLEVVDDTRAEAISVDRDQVFTDTTRWLRQAKGRMRECLQAEPVPTAQANARRGYMERVSIVTFTGAPEDFHEFKRVFTELTEGECYSPAVLLAQLRKHIPETARKLIQGYMDIKEAWMELERMYGSRESAIISARDKLMNVILKGPAHEQVESLLQAVRVARASLRAVKAEEMLFGDYAAPGVLVGKLPPSCQERWDLYVTERDSMETPQALGEVFAKWLDREGAAAISARTRHLNNELRRREKSPAQTTTTSCTHCSLTTHLTANCPQARHTSAGLNAKADVFTVGVAATGDSSAISTEEWGKLIQTEAGSKVLRDKAKSATKPCPLCMGEHTFPRKLKWGVLEWPSQRFESCEQFRGKTPQERGKIVQEQGGCGLCTSWTHVRRRCYLGDNKRKGGPALCVQPVGNGLCGKEHHRLLHGSANVYCQANTAMVRSWPPLAPRPDLFTNKIGNQLTKGTRSTLFEFTTAKLVSHNSDNQLDGIIFTDPGANINFIRTKVAEELGLKGNPTVIQLRVVDQEYVEREAQVFQVGVVDRYGGTHWIETLGVNTITQASPPDDMSSVRKVFPNIQEEALHPPSGQVSILLSMTERHLHATGVRSTTDSGFKTLPSGVDRW